MTCNVPINIIRQKTDVCFLKCKLWYKYGNSSCLVTNKHDQVSIVYDGQSDVMFNSVPYTPTEIKIFKPSIHTYDGEYAEAELLIMHSGGQNGLAICIPITLSNNRTYSKATDLLEEIINNIPNIAKSNFSDDLEIDEYITSLYLKSMEVIDEVKDDKKLRKLIKFE